MEQHNRERLQRVGMVGGTAIVTIIVLFAALAFGLLRGTNSTLPDPSTVTTPQVIGSGLKFDYIVVIVMENKNRCTIIVSCGGSASWMSSLAAGSFAASDSGELTNDKFTGVHPSLGNYLSLSSGTNFGCQGYDGGPQSNNCTNIAWQGTSIVNSIVAAGGTWKAYMEDKPTTPTDDCATGVSDSARYVVRHNPFEYLNSIRNTPSMCSRVVAAGHNATVLVSDLASTSTASNFMWLTPNNCHSMHDTGCGGTDAPGGVPGGDAFLKLVVGQIVNTTVFQNNNNRAAVFITFDEDSSGSTPQSVYTVWASKASGIVKDAASVTSQFNHFSFVATIEQNWALSPITVATSGATPMFEAFD